MNFFSFLKPTDEKRHNRTRIALQSHIQQEWPLSECMQPILITDTIIRLDYTMLAEIHDPLFIYTGAETPAIKSYREQAKKLSKTAYKFLPDLKQLTIIKIGIGYENDENLRGLLLSAPKSVEEIHVEGFYNDEQKCLPTRLTEKAFDDLTLVLPNLADILFVHKTQFPVFNQKNYKGPKLTMASVPRLILDWDRF